MRVTRAALPHLRASGGHVVTLSSVAALDPLGNSGDYAAAKAAVAAMSEALAQEVERHRIGVTVVGLGSFRTDFLSERSIRHTAIVLDAYRDMPGCSHFTQLAGRQQGDPVRAADLIVDAVDSGNAPLHLVVGDDAIQRARRRTAALLSDIEDWHPRSAASAYP